MPTRARWGLGLAGSGLAVLVGSALFGVPGATATTGDPCAAQPGHLIVSSGRITGTTGDDVIYGSSGHDVIDGRGGNDVICAGGGNDDLNGGAGNDKLYGQGGRDTFRGSTGTDCSDKNWNSDDLGQSSVEYECGPAPSASPDLVP